MLHIVTNGGSLEYKTMGTLKMFPMVAHYNEDSIANIISLHRVASLRGVRITMDTNIEKDMIFHFNGTSVKFKECSEGLYYSDTKNSINKNIDSVTDYPKSS